jgi:hypothetical protein
MAGSLTDIAGRNPQAVKGVKDFVSPLIRVDTTYDNSMADAEMTGQLMRMDGKVQRGSPQGLSSVLEDIEENFSNSYEI